MAISPAMGELLKIYKRGGAPVAGAVGTDADTIRFRVSDESPDHFGDIVVQRGLEFPATLPAVADHDHRLDAAVGSWANFKTDGNATYADLRLVSRGASRMADLVRALHAEGHPIASSIYFTADPADVEKIGKSSRYKRGQVREITLTQFPANPRAVAIARSLQFSDAELAALTGVSPAAALTEAKPAGAHNSLIIKGKKMDLSEILNVARSQLDAASAAHDTALAALNDNPDTVEAVAKSTEALTSARKRVETLEAAERAQVARAVAAPTPAAVAATPRPAAPAVVSRAATKNDKAGDLFARMVVARYIAANQHAALHDTAERLFPDRADVIAVARSAVGVADTTTTGWAKELIRADTRLMIQEELRPISVFSALSAMGTMIPFNGAQRVLMPSGDVGLNTGSTAWVGQGGVIPVVKGTFAEQAIEKFKVAGIVPATEELVRSAIDPGAMAVFRGMLLQFLANLLDKSLLDNSAAVAGIRPAGLLNNAATAAGVTGGGTNAVQGDLKAMLGTFISSNVGKRPVILVNTATKLSLSMITTQLGEMLFRDEVSQNRLLGLEVIASQHVPAATAILVDAGYFASAYDGPELEESAHATLTLANADQTAPTQAIDAVGALSGHAEQVGPDLGIHVSGPANAGAGVGATLQAVSLYQTWSRAIRAVIPVGFAMTKANTVVTRTSITW